MTTSTLHARAYAKINWDLHILGKRPDHFHELDSVFVTIGLSDAMRFETADELSLTCSDPTLPVDGSNLVMKAATLLKQAANCSLGAKIHLEKHIPMGGGLGGGSSDAACALNVLNQLWNLNWSTERLAEIAAQVGSDVSYFLYSGWCLCRGRGEIVQRLPQSKEWPSVTLLLILPPLHVSTPLVYKALNAPQWNGTGGRDAAPVGPELQSAVVSLRLGKECELKLRNDLTAAALQVEPQLATIQEILQRFFPGRWLMSGSGASHFAIAQKDDDAAHVQTMLEVLRAALPETRAILTETRSCASVPS